MAACVLTISVRFPWWWRLYLRAVIEFHNAGLIDADPVVAVELIMRHTRLVVVPK